jgi:hypothetical protein
VHLPNTGEADRGHDPDRVADALLSLAASFGVDRNLLWYVSTPITTGRRYYDWLDNVGRGNVDDPAWTPMRKREVEDPNKASAHALVTRVRSMLKAIVVDPTGLDVQGWAQVDYHNFWMALISRSIGTVVFNDGWEYSTGCVFEYSAALSARLTILDAELVALPPQSAIELVDSAIHRLKSDGHQPARLDTLLAARDSIDRLEHLRTTIDGEAS